MRLKPSTLLFSISVFGLSSCKKDDPVPNDAPTFEVTVSPLTIQSGATFTVNVTVKNFELDTAGFGGANAPGKGHWHVYLDQKGDQNELDDSAQTTETVSLPAATTTGPHTLIVALVNNDHTPLSPPVEKTVAITVQGIDLPPPTLMVTLDNNTITAGGMFTVSLSLTNFTLDTGAIGGANVPGRGHYHIWVDTVGPDTRIKDTASNPYTTTLPADVTPGSHTLIVGLVNNDHTPLSPAVQQSITITVNPAPPPTLSVTLDNETIEAGQYFVATVNVQYFILDELNFMMANIPKHGHWHVYIDSVIMANYLGASPKAQERIQIPATTTAGPHNLIFTLNENDHTALAPPVEVTLPITVAIVLPPPGVNVTVEGNTTKLGAYLAGTVETVGDASILVYGVNPVLTAVSDTAGAYSLQVPSNGEALIFSNKAGYNPSYNYVTTADQNIVGKRLYVAENAWISAIATYHNVDIAAPFACQTVSLAGVQCIYAVIVGRIDDDGYDGNGEIRPVEGIAKTDITIAGGPNAAPWYTKGPYFMNYDGTPSNAAASTRYLDATTNKYRGGLFVTFVEIPQLDGPPYVDFSFSIAYADAARAVTRYWGPFDVKAFRPYGVSWVVIKETGVPVIPPLVNINFDTQVYPLFLPVNQGGLGCQGCHNAVTLAGGMNLETAETAYNSLNPATYPQRVNLVDKAASYVLKRPLYEVDGVQDHPIFAFASENDVGYRTIYQWIDEGAIREVVLAPVTFDEIRTLLYAQPTAGGAGCRGCHYDNIQNPNQAPGGFFISNVPADLFTNLTNQAPTDPDPAASGYLEAYRINKIGYPERSLVLVRPLAGNQAIHPVKIFADNADPRYQLIYRWVSEGYPGPL